MKFSMPCRRSLKRHIWVAGIAATTALLVACGGGGGDTSGGTGNSGTTSSVSGPINGFGSIIVNGVRFDDSSAKVILNDEESGRAEDLKLGMVASIEGIKDENGTTGRADSISVSSYVQGPISDTPSGDRFTVLGITVTVNARTLYEDVAGFSGLARNDTVEVHGLPNATGGVTATRIEKKTTTEVRLTGNAENVTASNFQINGITVEYQPDDLHNLSASVTEGMLVRVRGTAESATLVDATRVSQVRLNPSMPDGLEVEIKGYITRFVSTADFDVSGQAATLAADAEIEGPLALNTLVEVEGVLNDGVLVAKEVKQEDDTVEQEYEMHAAIANLDEVSRTFTVRDGTITVQWNDSTVFDELSENDLVNNLQVEIKGEMVNGILMATRIKQDDD